VVRDEEQAGLKRNSGEFCREKNVGLNLVVEAFLIG